MRKKFTSIRGRLILIVSLAVILSVASIGMLGIRYIKASTTEYLDELLMLKCDNMESNLDGYLKGIEQCVDTIGYYASEDLEKKGEINYAALENHIQSVNLLFHSEVHKTPGIVTYYYRIAPEISEDQKGFWYQKDSLGTFRSGELTDITAYTEKDESRAGWYYIPKKEKKSLWLEPYKNDNMGGLRMISYVAPVFSNGKFIGVVGIDYNYDTLTKHIRYDGHFKGAYSFLTNNNDEIIYHPTLEPGTSIYDKSELLYNNSRSGVKNVMEITYEGEKKRATWSILTNGMKLYLVTPEESYKEYWFGFTRAFILSALLLLVLFIVLAIILSNHVTRPLAELTDAAVKIEHGDYDVDLTYDGKNEIGLLTRTFKHLTDHLKVHIRDLNDKAYKDALTSVKNKGAFNAYRFKLDEDIKSDDGEENNEFCICVFDCNDLKKINDSYGHVKGDVFIKKACDHICEVFMHSPVFRMGGDEFVCVLTGKDYLNREELFRKFDEKATEKNRETDNAWEKVDIAMGHAVFDPKTDSNVRDVLKRADKKMYADKESKKLLINNETLDGLS